MMVYDIYLIELMCKYWIYIYIYMFVKFFSYVVAIVIGSCYMLSFKVQAYSVGWLHICVGHISPIGM